MDRSPLCKRYKEARLEANFLSRHRGMNMSLTDLAYCESFEIACCLFLRPNSQRHKKNQLADY